MLLLAASNKKNSTLNGLSNEDILLFYIIQIPKEDDSRVGSFRGSMKPLRTNYFLLYCLLLVCFVLSELPSWSQEGWHHLGYTSRQDSNQPKEKRSFLPYVFFFRVRSHFPKCVCPSRLLLRSQKPELGHMSTPHH